MALVPTQVPPVQVNDAAAGVQLAESVAVPPTMIEAGEALRVQDGGVAIWHDCQFTPVAVFQAASLAGTPLVVKKFPQSALCPAAKEAGGAGTEPDNWLLSTLRIVNGNPLSDGIDPLSRLLDTEKVPICESPGSADNVPTKLLESKLIATTRSCLALQVTPNQVHTVPNGPFQLVLLVQDAPFVVA